MRDPRRKKMLQLRRKHLSGDRPSLYSLFNELFPCNSRHKGWSLWSNREEWDRRWNHEQEWISKVTGVPSGIRCGGGAPAWFRKDLNRKYRNKERQEIRDAVATGDINDLNPPNRRADADWLWW